MILDRRDFLVNALYALPSVAFASQTSAERPQYPLPAGAISLAGIWSFALDPKSEGAAHAWFNSPLPDQIELPGSCEQRGFGFKPEVAEVRRLTRVLKYVGQAWYQREIEVPEEWSGKRVELFLELPLGNDGLDGRGKHRDAE